MSNQIGNRSPMHQRRLKWLKRNKSLWLTYDQHLPGSFAIEKLLLDKMKRAGLYPPKATILDVSIGNLIGKVRNSGRPKKRIAPTVDD